MKNEEKKGNRQFLYFLIICISIILFARWEPDFHQGKKENDDSLIEYKKKIEEELKKPIEEKSIEESETWDRWEKKEEEPRRLTPEEIWNSRPRIIWSESDDEEEERDPITDPDDYDSPEDYADDAWGEDFDEWDDAYDYWEENY